MKKKRIKKSNKLVKKKNIEKLMVLKATYKLTYPVKTYLVESENKIIDKREQEIYYNIWISC